MLAIVSLGLSSAIVLGRYCDRCQVVKYNNLFIYAKILLLSILVFCVLRIIFKWIDSKNTSGGDNDVLFAKLSHRRIIMQICMMIPWTITLLGSWPGFFCYDAFAEFRQFNPEGQLLTAHPLLHTLFLNGVIRFIHGVTGSYNFGIASLLFIQCLILSSIFIYAIKQEEKMHVPKSMQFITLLYFSASPVICLFSVCSTKDVLFSAFVLLLLLAMIETIKEHGRNLNRFSFLVKFIVLIFICCALRNNMLYALILAVPFLVFAVQIQKLRFLISVGIAIIAYLVWSGPIASMLGASSAYMEETLSVPAQQMVRAVEYSSSISDSQKQAVHDVCLYSTYVEDNADYTKSYLQGGKDKILSVWFDVMKTNKGIYLDAFLQNTQSAWDPINCTISGYNTQTWYDQEYCSTKTSLFACWTESPGVSNPKLPILHDAIWNISRMGVLEQIPFLRGFVSISWAMWICVIAISYIFIKNWRLGIVCFSLLGMLTLSVLMGPIVLVRYYLILFMAAPILIGLCFSDCCRI